MAAGSEQSVSANKTMGRQASDITAASVVTTAMSQSDRPAPNLLPDDQMKVLWRQLENDMRHPVQVEWRSYGWRIEVMGAYRVWLHERRLEFSVASRHDVNGFTDDPRADVSLRTPLPTGHWLRCWLWRRLKHCDFDPAQSAPDIERLALELQARMPTETLARMRAQIRDAMALDPELLALARRSQGARHLRLSHYCLVWQNLDAMRQREHESAALLPLFDLLRSGGRHAVDLFGHDYGVMRSHLEAEGLSPAGWRLLCRHGTALWSPLRRSHEFDNNPSKMLVTWANLLAAMHTPTLPPTRLALAWAMTHSMGDGERVNTSAEARLLHAAWREYKRTLTRVHSRHLIREQVVPVLQWWQTQGASLPLIPARAGWRWFARQAAQADWQAMAAALDACDPGGPDFNLEVGGIRFTRLCSLASLFKAGLAFRNCLVHVSTKHEGVVKEGGYYSLSDANSGRLLALLRALETDEGHPVRVLELRGPFNQPVGLDVRRVVQRFVGKQVS